MADSEPDGLDDLREALDRLSTATDKLSSGFSSLAAGRPAAAVGSTVQGVGSAAGLEGLEKVGQAISAAAPILDRIAGLFPELTTHLRILAGSDLSKAGQKVSALAQEAAARGAPLPADFLRAQIAAEAAAERKRIAADAQVQGYTTESQWGRWVGGNYR